MADQTFSSWYNSVWEEIKHFESLRFNFFFFLWACLRYFMFVALAIILRNDFNHNIIDNILTPNNEF